MKTVMVNQAVHGYRDGHRLLQSSTPLATDAARSLLVLSDMSGPSLQSGFDEYLTGYPLPETDVYVLARTWYADEMRRPGCVWTHSILVDRPDLAALSPGSIISAFRRPSRSESYASYGEALELSCAKNDSTFNEIGDLNLRKRIIDAVFRSLQPTIVQGESAAALESFILALWMLQWPGARALFSFCTGALMPRIHAGALLDLQVVPRAVPSSHFRKIAASATVLDGHGDTESIATWVEIVVDDLVGAEKPFRTWLANMTAPEAKRNMMPALAQIFHVWSKPSVNVASMVNALAAERNLDARTIENLLEDLFARVEQELGISGELELLELLGTNPEAEIFLPAAVAVENRLTALFAQSRKDTVQLLDALLGMSPNTLGERVLREGCRSLNVSEVVALSAAHPEFLLTVVRANPQIATSPDLWRGIRSRGREILGAVGDANPPEDVMATIVDAVVKTNIEGVAEELVRIAGDVAVVAALDAMLKGSLHDDWHWRSALTKRAGAVLKWAVDRQEDMGDVLAVVASLLSPADRTFRKKYVELWQSRLNSRNAVSDSPRVAAFGLAIALSERGHADLLASSFQIIFDTLALGHLDHDAWEWLRYLVPPTSWWRKWDKCERVAVAVARNLSEEEASLSTVFKTARSSSALRKVVSALDTDWNQRRYLRSLREICSNDSSIGTQEQRKIFLENAW